jgi:tRNA threonylcarbamoyladenosine biosynthesis protein TsaB
LAYGTRCSRHVNGLPVLPLSTLAAVAENARLNWCQQHPHAHEPLRVAAMLDARMGEVYVGHYTFANPQQASAQAQGEPWLTKPEHIGQTLAAHAHCNLWAGNVFDVHAQHMAAPPCPSFATHPNAAALLRLALECWQPEHTVWAEGVQPLYVRNKVAQTTAERLQVRATTV